MLYKTNSIILADFTKGKYCNFVGTGSGKIFQWTILESSVYLFRMLTLLQKQLQHLVHARQMYTHTDRLP